MNDLKEKIGELKEKLAQANEDLFLAKSDLDSAKIENIALKNFIQNVYESCDGLDDIDIELEDLLQNLKKNIRVFARDNGIKL
jgi:hypothetical protein